eukprot:12642292-Ditylum_brightwellii.AAC.1
MSSHVLIDQHNIPDIEPAPTLGVNEPISSKQQQKHNNQLSCASTGTSGTPSSCHHHHHGNAALLLAATATILAQKPGCGTNNSGGL